MPLFRKPTPELDAERTCLYDAVAATQAPPFRKNFQALPDMTSVHDCLVHYASSIVSLA